MVGGAIDQISLEKKYISHHRTTFSSVEAKKLSYQLSGVCVKRYRKLEPKLVHCVTQLSWKPMGVQGLGGFGEFYTSSLLGCNFAIDRII